MDTRDFFKNILSINDEWLVDQLMDITTSIHVKKGEFLIREGEKQKDFIFLVHGIFRGYYLDSNGKEITECIGFESGTPGMSVAINNEVSPISIEALVPCEFIKIQGDTVMALIERNISLLKIYNDILQTAMKVHWELKIMVSQHTVLERYQWFLEKYPGLIDQISNKVIASYLGMTPVTLSRIRRTVRENPENEGIN